jgi:beta-lactamase regulating signal transducer with metallopeptidase domain
MAPLLDHLWQSTMVAALAALLTLALRNNGARIRFWLWFAASLKFLVPFAALAALGEMLARFAPVTLTAPPRLLATLPAAERFSAPAAILTPQVQSAGLTLAVLAGSVWAIGIAAVVGVRLVRSLKLRAVLRGAQDVEMAGPVRIKTSDSLLEPGLVGIFRPVVLLPQGLLSRLSHSEIQSILAHELTHLKRRDNLTAAIHMLVEALFWFYPLVWLIGARLIAERERACDENVLARGHDREVYAGGILKVCKFCLASPLACAAGMSGGNLGHRVRQIMTAPDARALPAPKKALLAGTAMLTLALPVMAGLLSASPLPQAISQVSRTVAAAADQALSRGVAMAQQIGVVPAPVELPRLKLASVSAPEAEPPSFTMVPAMEQPAPSAEQAAPQNAVVVAESAGDTLSPLKRVVWASDPRGQGDPDAITCRVPQLLPGSRLRGPETCQTNRVWAALTANRQIVLPDGKTVVATGWQSEACNSGRIAGVALMLPSNGTGTAYRCNY